MTVRDIDPTVSGENRHMADTKVGRTGAGMFLAGLALLALWSFLVWSWAGLTFCCGAALVLLGVGQILSATGAR